MTSNKMARFTTRARRVMVLAQGEAARLHHNMIEPEHLLLGLLLVHEEGGIAGRVLRVLGIDYEKAAEVIPGLTQSESTVTALSPATKHVLEVTFHETRRLGDRFIGTEHLLLGVIQESDGVAIETLEHFNISPEKVHNAIHQLRQEASLKQVYPAENITEEYIASLPTAVSPVSPISAQLQGIERFLMKLLEMVRENKLTSDQAAEMLRALLPETTPLTGEEIQFKCQFNPPITLEQGHARVVMTSKETQETKIEQVFPLNGILAALDKVVFEAALHHQSAMIEFGDNHSSIRLEFQVEEYGQ